MLKFVEKFKGLKTAYPILLIQQILWNLGFVFVPLFFRNHDYPLYFLVLIFSASTGIGALVVSLITNIRIRRFLIIGAILYLLAALILAISASKLVFFSYIILVGLTTAFHWVPLNYLFFRESEKQLHATHSWSYFGTFALTNMLLPALGALIISYFGFSGLFGIVAALSLLLLFYVVKNIPEKKIVYNLKDTITTYKGLRLITMIDGSIEFFLMAIVPIYLLIFVQNELQYGGFMTYLGFLGVMVALFFARKSDLAQDRIKYLTPLFFIMGLLMLAMAFTQSFFAWSLVLGAYFLVAYVSKPLRVALIMDVKKKDIGFWKAREIFLNIGRMIILSICMALFFYESASFVFIVFAALIFAYPFVIKYKLGGFR